MGLETDIPFGPPRKRPSFFQPIFKQLDKKIEKLIKGNFQVRKRLKEKILFFLKLQNETNNWIIEIFPFFKKIIRKMSTVNTIGVFGLKEASSEIKSEKDSRIKNHMIHESSVQIRFLNQTNSSVTEKKMKDLANRTRIIKNKIEKISNDKLKMSPKKTRYGTKNLGQILKRRNARLIRNSNYILKFFRERIYGDIFLYIINIPKINTQLFLESTKNGIDKSIYNNESITKTNKNRIQFISTINKKFLPFLSTSKNNSKIISDFSFLSQAYVFYKLSQAKILNLYKLRLVLQYRGISLFLKNEIKDFFGTQGITNSELKTKKLPNSGMNQWKNWLKLKNNYQYNLSQLKWSRLVPQKWRNRVTEHCEVENTNLYQNEELINSKKHLLLLPDQKYNFQKNYRYDVLSYKFFNYKNKNDSYRYSYGLPFQVNKNQEFSYTYNYNINNNKFIDMWWNIPISNFSYLEKTKIMDIDKNIDRKYLDFKILDFSLRNKIDIEDWIDISTSINENTKTEPRNYQIVEKINKKSLVYSTIYQEIKQSDQKNKLFDWMGMNEKILSRPISNLEFWFFSEFFSFYNAYKMKPWVIPINLLFSNSNVSEKFSKNKSINRKKKTNPFIPSNEKKSFELENRNQDEKELVSKEDLGSYVQENYEKDIEEDYISFIDIKKPIKQKQPKSVIEAEFDLFLKRYLLFQLKWADSLNEKLMDNIQVYCLVLRLINPIEILISSIERKELSMDIMLDRKDFNCPNWKQKRVLIIEPIRLSIRGDGQFLLYQTIGISLVHKSKHQNNQKRYSENVDKKFLGERNKNNFDLLAPENLLSPRRRRELRILLCLNSRNNNGVNTNPMENRVKNCNQFFDEKKDLDRDKNTLRNLKFFLWPNYRLEDLACMNRFWFDTNNGSRFSILRIHMYPQF